MEAAAEAAAVASRAAGITRPCPPGQLGSPAALRAERIETPASEDELGRAVAGAGRVKVAGSGHSFTDIACTDGVMLDMSRMRRVLGVDGNEVTVEAGITLRDLGEELRARGLAMENQGDVDPQTLAGAISTATHGTGARLRQHLLAGGRGAARRRRPARCASSPTATSSAPGASRLGALGAIAP